MDTRKPEQHNAVECPEEIVESLQRDGILDAPDAEFWAPIVSAARSEAAGDKIALDRIAYAVASRDSVIADTRVGVSAADRRSVFGLFVWSGAAMLVIGAFAAGFAAARWTADSHDDSTLQVAGQMPNAELAIAPKVTSAIDTATVGTLSSQATAAASATDSLPEDVWSISENLAVKQLRIDKPLRIEAKNRPIRLGRLVEPGATNQS